MSTLKTLYPMGLVKSYVTDGELASEVDTILIRLVRDHEQAVQSGRSGRPLKSYILPRIEKEQSAEPDPRGRMKRKTRRHLVFENEGSTEAQQVRWRLEKEEGVEGELPWAGDDRGGSGLISVIAGGAKY